MTTNVTRRQLGGLAAATLAMPAIAQGKTKLVVVMSSFDLLFWGTLTAKQLGYFDQLGLDIELVRAGGGARSLAAVAGGDAQFNVGAPASALRARARGSDVMLISPAVAQYIDNITMSAAWAQKNNITPASSLEARMKALKGMTVAVSSVGAGADQLLRFLAKRAGIDPDREMTITAIAGGENMMAAFMRGRIDGFVVPPPTGDDAVKNHGARPLIWPGRGEVPELNGFVYIGVIARESWLKQNRDTAARFLRGQQMAFDTIHDPARTASARDAVWTGFQQRIEKAMFDEIWAAAVPVYPKSVAVDQAMVDRIVDFVNETVPEPIDRTVAQTGWSNDYAAAALAART
jgi:NitT/TauT family transport system substrate-binding protein